jgi:hypothetical protein
MKLLISSLLLALSGGALLAQGQSVSNTAYGGLTVVNNKWNFEVRNPSLDQDPVQDTADRMEAERQRRDIERRNEILRSRGMPTVPVPPPLPPPRTDTLAPPPGPTITYVYQVNLKNSGPKEIRAVTWEYAFFDAESGKEVGRRRFVSRQAIRPGRSANLTLRSPAPPTGTVTAAEADKNSAPKFKEQIVILSVEYADGTKWPVR